MIKQLIDAKPARARLRSIIMSCAHGWPSLSFSVWQSGWIRQPGRRIHPSRNSCRHPKGESQPRQASPQKPLENKKRKEGNIQEIHGVPVSRWLN